MFVVPHHLVPDCVTVAHDKSQKTIHHAHLTHHRRTDTLPPIPHHTEPTNSSEWPATHLWSHQPPRSAERDGRSSNRACSSAQRGGTCGTRSLLAISCNFSHVFSCELGGDAKYFGIPTLPGSKDCFRVSEPFSLFFSFCKLNLHRLT